MFCSNIVSFCFIMALASPSFAYPTLWSSFFNTSSNASTSSTFQDFIANPNLFLNLNMQQLANVAMNPTIDNQTLTELYNEANEITNATGADSVLMELDPLGENNQTTNNSMVVLAVTNPNVPSHEDLLQRFRLYFVNLTETLPSMANSSQTQSLPSPLLSTAYSRPTLWNIFQNFLRNQANAVIGAFMMPFNVATNAMLTSANQHAEYVMTGSAFGSAISAPIILKAIAIPNYIAQRVIDLDSYKVSAVESAEERTKQGADIVVENGAELIVNGTLAAGRIAHRYIIRPIGAFTGFNLNLAGNTLTHFGEGIASTGTQLNRLGQTLNNGAIGAVSAGAKAIAWGMDETVQLYNNGNITANIANHVNNTIPSLASPPTPSSSTTA